MKSIPETKTWVPQSIWRLALAYGAAYAVFGVYTHVQHRALAAILEEGPARWRLLVGFAAGLLVMLPGLVLFLHRRGALTGRSAAAPGGAGLFRGRAIASGLAAATIALSTATAFSFGGVSVVLALLLMRGGVLILSPLVDFVSHRPIDARSRRALVLSLAAVSISIAWSARSVASPLLLLTLAIYLGAYFIRLSLMSWFAKQPTEGARAVYARNEFIWAFVFLAPFCVAALVWVLAPAGGGEATSVGAGPVFGPVFTGIAYGFVLLSGTLIYLDPRENTFTIPINRGASLLGGVLGASGAFLWGFAARPPMADYLGAAIIIMALAILARRPAAGAVTRP